jgi:hypothetical protein
MFNLRRLFVLVAIVEAFYGAAGLLIPPGMVKPLLGWQLNPDGQWVTKLLGAALATQALTAWVLRKDPPVAMAYVFAAYQIGATLVDAVLWATLADQGIFTVPLARYSVIVAIPTHFLIGVLLIVAAMRHPREAAHA